MLPYPGDLLYRSAPRFSEDSPGPRRPAPGPRPPDHPSHKHPSPPTATSGCTEILDRSLVPLRPLPPGLKVSKARTTAYAPGLTPKGWGRAHRRYMVPLCFPELEPARVRHALGPDNRPTNVPQSPFFLRGENETSGARTGCLRSHRDGDMNAIFMGVRTRGLQKEKTLCREF